jgi:hypothetical protein
MRQITAILLPLLLTASVLRAGSTVSSCDAPTFGEKRPRFRPGPTVVYDTMTLEANASLSRADSQAVQEARVDIGVRCAIEVMSSLGGLRTYELLTSAHICALQPSAGAMTSPHQQGIGFDRIELCRIEFGRDSATRRLVHVTLRVYAHGGVVDVDGSKVAREYEVRLVRYAGSSAWTVDNYVTRFGE